MFSFSAIVTNYPIIPLTWKILVFILLLLSYKILLSKITPLTFRLFKKIEPQFLIFMKN